MGITGKKMETTIMGYMGIIGYIVWLYMGIMEKTMETTGVNMGLYWGNGKENGNYYIGYWGILGFRVQRANSHRFPCGASKN